MNEMTGIPGGARRNRPLNFILLLDASGSMSNDGKIQALNNAIRETIPALREHSDLNPGVELLVRALKFGSRPEWHMEQRVEIHNLVWRDISAAGETAMGGALKMAAQVLADDQVGPRALPPVLVLISDGLPTDDFRAGLRALLAAPLGKKAIRMSVAIGRDANEETLREFNSQGIPVVRANAPEQLVERIRLVSVSAVQSSSVGGGSQQDQLKADLIENAPEAQAGSVW